MDIYAILLLGLTNDIPSHQLVFLFVLITLPIEPRSIVIYLLKNSSQDFKEGEHEYY
jgi:hypothetical protein